MIMIMMTIAIVLVEIVGVRCTLSENRSAVRSVGLQNEVIRPLEEVQKEQQYTHVRVWHKVNKWEAIW